MKKCNTTQDIIQSDLKQPSTDSQFSQQYPYQFRYQLRYQRPSQLQVGAAEWLVTIKAATAIKTAAVAKAALVMSASLLLFTACEKQPPELVGGSELSNSVISPIEVDPNKLNTPSAHSEDTGTVMVPLSCRNSLITEAFNEQRSAVQVKGCGKVVAILPDDNEGSRHQRFIVQLEGIQPDHTVLIAHNIDLASRIDALKKGDDVVFYGQYEYNSQGGVVHWTHHDPAARHQHGWIEHKGKRFE